MEELKTYAGIGALLQFRDELRQKAVEILELPTQELEEAKAKYHSAKVRSNQLNKRADAIQDAITLEMQMAHDAEKKVQEAYEYHQSKEDEYK